MRISADCIEDEEQDIRGDDALSEPFARMALKDNKMNDTLTAEDIRVIYKVNCRPNSSVVSLAVIPVTDHYRNGYKSNWNEVKQQVLDLNFKEKSKVSNNLSFMGRIESAGYELPLLNQDEYFTALKVAELCGQPLEIMIRNSVEDEVQNNESTTPSATPSTSKDLVESNASIAESKHSSSDSENESNEDKNGFVVLESAPEKASEQQKSDSSTQLSSENVVLTKSQIEDIKKEITIDVTKRLISKLTECLTELTLESTVASAPTLDVPKVDSTNRAAPVDNCGQASSSGCPVVHIGIICDNCDHQIRGVRYKCNNCLDFDLCENCKQMPTNHDISHTFNKIERYIRGIPNQTSPHNLDFLKPYLSGATFDPKTRDIYLSLDLDLTNGKITTTPPSEAMPTPNESAKAQKKDQNSNNNQNLDEMSGASNGGEEDGNSSGGPQQPHRRYVSEKKANKIAKKLEKLKFKSQMYSNLLPASDERSGVYSTAVYGADRAKPSTVGLNQSQPNNSNKTLYLSGLLVGDETIPEGTRMPPGTRFRKTWKVRNTGTKVWTGRTTLRFVWGQSELEPFGKVTEVQAPTLRPGEEGKVTIRFTSPNPSNITRYQSHWRLHHRGQPFGQRLVCKIIVDPSASSILPAPNAPAPILAKPPYVPKEIKSTTAQAIPTRPAPKSPYLGMNGPNPNFHAIAQIHQSILESQRNLSDRLRVITNQSVLKHPNRDRTQKTSVKKLTEALSAVKEIRFNLDDNEAIPMKTNVKSHTATPANTPFDVSPPKSPEPNSVSNSFTQIESNEKNVTNDSKDKREDVVEDDKAIESDNESLDVLSLSSAESGDEFVLVPLPSCFDLNVPFGGVDNRGFEDSKDGVIEYKTPNDNNCFELIEDNSTKNDETLGSGDDTTLSPDSASEDTTAISQQNPTILDEPNHEIALDLTKDKHREENLPTDVRPTAYNGTQPEAEPQVRPKAFNASTNPFRNNPNETENVIHVLPESIVTGALSAAAHVYNNVKTTFFSPRNEGNHFAWVTSPPPAALPLPDMYWENRRAERFMAGQPVYSSPVVQPNSAPINTPMATGVEPQPTPRLASALTQLFEMGFWNQKLNQELLEKNDFDVNDTIEDLLSPGKVRQRRSGPNSTSEPVVSHQPQNNRNNGLEFD